MAQNTRADWTLIFLFSPACLLLLENVNFFSHLPVMLVGTKGSPPDPVEDGSQGDQKEDAEKKRATG